MQGCLCLSREMDLNAWQTQLRKGAAELVVLSVLSDREATGVAILNVAGRSGGIVSDGTIYPLLTRLERDGKIASRWDTADSAGTPRKYYRLTAEGASALIEMQKVWKEFSTFVSSFMEGGENGRADQGSRGLSRAAG